MIDGNEFTSAVMRRFELAGSAEGVHLRLVDGNVHELIRYSFGGGGAKPRSVAE
jgi:hypothetical protein